MILRVYAIGLGLTAIVGGVLVFGESPVASPGPISETHADLELECRGCHSPFQGTTPGCESCHGGLPTENIHANENVGCGDCHSEHQGYEVSIVQSAAQACSTCHEHASIADVEAHGVGGAMARHLDLNSVQRMGASAFGSFSHAVHFEEAGVSDDPQCESCHLLGVSAGPPKGDEHRLRWSGCEECHDDWSAAGFEQRGASNTLLIALERFPRVAFRHSEGHLEAPCETCHTGIREAMALDEQEGHTAETTAADLSTCFGCHVHQPVSALWPMSPDAVEPSASVLASPSTSPSPVPSPSPLASPSHAPDYALGSVVECVECHEFHGTALEADFLEDPGEEPRAEGLDVLGRAGYLTFTPWLGLFLILGATGWVAVLRRLPKPRSGDAITNPDVAPQRVSESPVLSPFFETSVSGLYIIGELAGVPLVNRAMKSGFDVIDFIANRLGREAGAERSKDFSPEDEVLDVLIVGSGPAGLGASTRAQSLGLTCVVCEKSTAAATIRDYPRAKIIQAAPVDIPDYGSFFQEEDESKDALVRRWEDIIARTGVAMREREEVVDIQSHAEGGFVVEIESGKAYRAHNVVLAIGTRGTPRRLGVDGEVPDRVFYNLIDAEEYRELDILVVGGGNAAVEAALDLSQPELLNRVTLAHRGPVLKGITPLNSSNIDTAAAEGQLELVPNATMDGIQPSTVLLGTPNGSLEIPNGVIFAMIGAELPMRFLKKVGVKMAKKGGF